MKKTILASALAIAMVSTGAMATGSHVGSSASASGAFTAAGAVAHVGPGGGSVSVQTGAAANNQTYRSSNGAGENGAGSNGSASSYSFGTQTGAAHGAAGSIALQGGYAASGSGIVGGDVTINPSSLGSGKTAGGLLGGVSYSAAGQAGGAATGVIDNGASEYWVESGAHNETALDGSVNAYSCQSCSTVELDSSGSTSGYSYVNGGGYSEGQAAGASGALAGEMGGYRAEGGAKVKEYDTEFVVDGYLWVFPYGHYETEYDTVGEGSTSIDGNSYTYAAGGGGSIGNGEVRYYQGSSAGGDSEAYLKMRHCGSGCNVDTEVVSESYANAGGGEYFAEGNSATSSGNAIAGGTTGGKGTADAVSVGVFGTN